MFVNLIESQTFHPISPGKHATRGMGMTSDRFGVPTLILPKLDHFANIIPASLKSRWRSVSVSHQTG